jgi:Peptidase S24-like
MLLHMQDTIEKHRLWVRWIMRKTGKKITPLATDAGMSSTTLSRMDDADFNGYSQRTINIVMEAYNVPAPDEWALGLAEDDAAPWEGAAPEFDLNKASRSSKAADIWKVETDALLNLGYRRGDMILVDLNATPENGDVVVVQLYDVNRGRAKTLLRLYNFPYLSAASVSGKPHEIITLDAGNVAIKGVVSAMLRLRKTD